MKLCRHGDKGREGPGIMDAEGRRRDLSGHICDLDGEMLRPENLDKIRAIDVSTLPIIADEIRYGPCVAGIGKFLCVGLNYSDHAEESGFAVPTEPEIFLKATSAVCGPNDAVIKPKGATKLDWEVELGIVIGADAAYVEVADAPGVIAGFCVINDISERAFQLERGTQWDKGKGCDSFGPIGPWLVTPEQIADVLDLNLWLAVNGRRYQHGNTRSMIFKPDYLVSYISRFMSLQPGDVISTGTPPGVGLGQDPPVYLNAGDEMVLGIDELGQQRQRVISLL